MTLCKNLKSYFLHLIFITIFIFFIKLLHSSFFDDKTFLIKNNYPRLSYGIAVSDVNQNGSYEFIVTGYQDPNLALTFKDNQLINIINDNIFLDETRKAIGVVACDIDADGIEEIYFLNTDTFSGSKKFSDRLLDLKDGNFIDLFDLKVNSLNVNLTAGRSVACIDNEGDGKFAVYVSNYGGPSRFYKVRNNKIYDIAKSLKINKTTGGRAVVAGHILSDRIDIFASNERGSNFLYQNNSGKYLNVAKNFGVEDTFQNGRGTALSDILYRGRLDIISGNWEGYHRVYILKKFKFIDLKDPDFNRPSKIRTIISADFDNDGYDEIFMNNIGQSNKLFKIKDNGLLEKIDLIAGKLQNNFGTGAAVADIDNDGILELLIANGENLRQPLKLLKAKIKDNSSYLRIEPFNKNGAPARGATVTLKSNLRSHSKTIDAGSGYLCQMEPVAHFGIRKNEKNITILIRWSDGSQKVLNIESLNKKIKVRQS